MSEWSLLKTPSSKDFLSSYNNYSNHEQALQMMSSFIDNHNYSNTTIYDENTFCTKDNTDECITHLNQELSGVGLQTVSHDSLARVPSLINRLEELLRLYQRNGRIKEDLENRLHRLSVETSEQQCVICRLKVDKERLEKQVAQEQEKHRQAHNKIKNLSSKVKGDKDELRRMQAVIRDRDSQYKHELKKKQREVDRLMERLHQLLLDKNPDTKLGMAMVGYLKRGGSKRGTWKINDKSTKMDEMYQSMMSNYESKQQELRVENTDLRDCLLDIHRELTVLVDTSDSTLTPVHTDKGLVEDSSEEDISTSSSRDLNDDIFQLPYDMLRENLQKSFQDTCRRLRQSMSQGSSVSTQSIGCKWNRSSVSKSPVDHKNIERDKEKQQTEIDRLHKQVDKYKEIVKQQEQLIQQSLCSQSKSMETTFLQESQILQEKESLSEQRRKLYQEKADFEEERRNVAENARLIQQQKKQLEEEKAVLFRSQFLQMSTTGQSKAPTPPKSKEKTRLLPSTPMFSPAPGKSTVKPSTADLLKLLSSPNNTPL